MGFFSANCPGCDHSIRSHYSINETSAWMKRAVLLSKNAKPVKGDYDGYGNIEGSYLEDEDMAFMSAEVWHRACWMLAGQPKFTKPSRDAHDQGYFVGEYDPSEPSSQADMDALKAKAQADREERKAKRLKEREEAKAEYIAKGEPVPEWLA